MITVFTPTYNRAHTLGRLFESLLNQTCSNFEWIVVDDGSTDNTQELLCQLACDATFPMRYVTQRNLGKHAAINLGASLAKGEWFFIVDSDDFLSVDAIEVSSVYLNQISDDPSFAGVVGLRGLDNRTLLWPIGYSEANLSPSARAALGKEYIDATSVEYRYKLGIPGDRAEIVRTELLHKNPFPIFNGEKFLNEDYFWQSLSDQKFKFRWFNRITYYSAYLEDGLTRNNKKAWAQSPKGSSFINNFYLQASIPFRFKPRKAVNYIRYGRAAGMSFSRLLFECNRKLLFFIALPLAFVRPVN